MARLVRQQDTLLIRHLFICLSAIAAYVFRGPLGVGNEVLWVFGLAAALNVSAVFLGERHGRTEPAALLSTLFGLGAWTALVNLTGGATSPLSAGLGFEILLSVPAARPRRTLLIGGAAVTGLWGQEFAHASEPVWRALGWQTGFLAAVAMIAVLTAHTWARKQHELDRRLRDTETQLEDGRALRRIGENVARLSHGILNTVHSLRGLTRLIEYRLTGTENDTKLLRELERMTARIEELSQVTLAPAARPARDATPCADIAAVVRDAVVETARSYPALQWVTPSHNGLPAVKLPDAVLREVLLVLTRNAAEASAANGKITISAHTAHGTVHLAVADEGRGVPETDRSSLFRPGFTTKPDGHGYGLFVSRRLLESHGGTLTTAHQQPVGTVFTMSMPVWEA